MLKNSKVTLGLPHSDPVTESVADLLTLAEPLDYKSSRMSMGLSPGAQPAMGKGLLPSPGDEEGRPAWNSKLQYILAQVGFSVGLGNVWRFPYLCQKNGGGAYLVPYFILLILIGIPLFFLELAVGQRIRRGSIGVWNYVYPQLGGIGVSSLMVCGFVGLYYNVIIGWSIFYFFQSFQYPLPWAECPIRVVNGSQAIIEPECEKSSATTYFWYRQTLNITSTIEDSGGLNWKMTMSLFAAWLIVCLAVIKGIQSSGKVTGRDICLTVLIVATVIEMAVSPAGYNAWVEELASEKFLSYPPWALGVAYSLIIAAMLPLPCVFIARHFNLLSDGSNKLSVSYRKGMTKELSGLEEENESRFILGKGTPSPSPSPMPSHRPYLGPGGAQEMTNTAGYGTGTPTKTGYQNINSPESEL
ncbi:sodium-dependent neutral amino acid transporter SLC6A17 [Oncorhynchus kisutch]|uniref:sodium-dependent neutral amino acid transporter SLC6A17 n=1 Tax=Oncorhynchus kisutch TaxID=8019 RepID=UPI0012DD7963|nr:sodium-dependent neutral amino acid transporter SLC6A17-like [Oncorhynchus kisutch]